MKTFVRLIRRYVLAAVGIVLLLLFSGVAVLGWLGWQESCRLPQREYSSSEIADSMVETAEGLAFGAERTPQEWMNGYEWAMVLDDVGNIRWSYGLPQELNHAYTPGDIAKFARWYLADYPVFCWTEPYGLFVIGLPKGSLWKYSIYSSPDFALSMVRVLPAAALGMLLLGLVLCFWLSWRGAKRLETVANGLDALAQGQTVRLPTDGFAGELAEKLNQTGAHFCQKRQLFSVQQICRDLKMEIRNSIIVLLNIFPDFHCVLMITVEGSVNKFHLRNLMIYKKLQFLFHKLRIPEAKLLFHRGKTVTAGKRTATARLIINDAVLKFFQVCIGKIHLGQIHNRTPRVAFDCTVCITVCNAMDLLQRFPLHPILLVLIINCYFPESHFSLAFHNSGKERILLQHLLCMVRHLRSAKPDLCFGTDFMIFCNQILYD